MQNQYQMDVKPYPKSDYDETVLLETLRKKIKSELGGKIADKIQQQFGDKSVQNSVVCHGIADAVYQELSGSEAFSNLKNSFMHDVKNILKESTKYENEAPRHSKYHDSKKHVSVSSSFSSSLNSSSVVFLNAEQLNNIACLLLHGSPVHKLDALQTLCHLSSLEHLVTQSLWPSLENGLHKSLSSNIHFIRDCSFKLFAKMLTSPIPQVVKESYHSLIKCLSNNITFKGKKANKYGVDVSKQSINFNMAVRIITLLNRFQQHISSHWLRYPQSIIEDIISGSVKLLTLSISDGNELVAWRHVSVCDPSANWLNNFLHGNVSRELILSEFQKHQEILKCAFNFCETFYSQTNYKQFVTNDGEKLCCSKSIYFYEVAHSLCFLTHILEFNEGRQLLNALLPERKWLYVFKVVLLNTLKLSDISCHSCFLQCSLTVSRSWVNILKLESPETCTHLEEMFEILINPISFLETRNSLSKGSVCFIAQSLCKIASSSTGSYCLFKLKDIVFGFIALEYFSELTRSAFMACREEPAVRNNKIMCVSLHLIGSLLTSPLSAHLLTKCDVIHMVIRWWKDICNSPYVESLKFNGKFYVASEKDSLKKEIMFVVMSFLKTPLCTLIYCKAGAFEAGISLLFCRTFKGLENGNFPCMCDVNTLAMFLSHASLVDCYLKAEDVAKISWAVWHWSVKSKHHGRNRNLKKTLMIVKALAFAISDTLFYLNDALFQNTNIFNFVLFIPPIKKDEFMIEESKKMLLALNVISLLICNIKSFCLLQAKYELQEDLLSSQSDFMLSEDNFLVDEVSVLQNHILVKSFAVGGPNERCLPPKTLVDVNETYNWPFITSYPIPDIYYHTLNEHVNNFENTVILDNESLKQMFSCHMRKYAYLSKSVIVAILKESIKYMIMNEFLQKSLKVVDFCSVDGLPLEKAAEIGINMCVRYGTQLKAISGNCEFEMNYILKSCKALFGSTYCKSFDLFPATIYLMLEGDFQLTWKFLEKFAATRNSLYVWIDRLDLLSQVELNHVSFLQGILFQLCDLIVLENLPTLFASFQLCGTLPSVIFAHWVGQCFWNYLDWIEICHFVLMSVVFGGDYCIYFFVAVLKHLKSKILKLAHCKDLITHLKQDSIENFSTAAYMEYIEDLASTYHKKLELLFDVNDFG